MKEIYQEFFTGDESQMSAEVLESLRQVCEGNQEIGGDKAKNKTIIGKITAIVNDLKGIGLV